MQSLKQVRPALTEWELIYNAYLDAGGGEMSSEDRRGQLLRILPGDVRKEVFRRISDVKSIDDIREWIRIQAELEDQWDAEDVTSRRRGPVEAAGAPARQRRLPDRAGGRCGRLRSRFRLGRLHRGV